MEPAAGLRTAELNEDYRRSLIRYKMKNGTQAPAPPPNLANISQARHVSILIDLQRIMTDESERVSMNHRFAAILASPELNLSRSLHFV